MFGKMAWDGGYGQVTPMSSVLVVGDVLSLHLFSSSFSICIALSGSGLSIP